MVDVISAFMRGLEGPIMLWIMSNDRPVHGYALIKEFERLTGQKLKPSKLYPLLYRLEDEGIITGEWIKKGCRAIRCYHLTQKGKTLLAEVTDLFKMPIKTIFIELLNE